MSLLKYSITFLLGIYTGQEYANSIPNVKEYILKSYKEVVKKF